MLLNLLFIDQNTCLKCQEVFYSPYNKYNFFLLFRKRSLRYLKHNNNVCIFEVNVNLSNTLYCTVLIIALLMMASSVETTGSVSLVITVLFC